MEMGKEYRGGMSGDEEKGEALSFENFFFKS